MIRYENNCVGCPQGCVHCGRGRYPVYECDGAECFYSTDDGNYVYEVGGKHYCQMCYQKMFGDLSNAVTAREVEEEKARYE